MAFATTSDGVQLFYESAGQGTPIVFVHEFGGNHWSWEPQVSYFSRRHLCITFSARGYPPSDIPEERGAVLPGASGRRHRRRDECGRHREGPCRRPFDGRFRLPACRPALIPDRILSAVVAGAGYGSEKEHQEFFRRNSEQVARGFEERGAAGVCPRLRRERLAGSVPGQGSTRLEALRRTARAALRQRGRQHHARRSDAPSVALRSGGRTGAMQVPLLVVVGDEDDHSIQPGIFLKRTVPRSGLTMFPKSGHTLNLEEPALFNHLVAEFIAQVEAGRWGPRDPRADPRQIMRAD